MPKEEIVNLGIKKVSKLTFLKVIVLPKVFTDFLDDDMLVVMELFGDTLMITPANSPSLVEVE